MAWHEIFSIAWQIGATIAPVLVILGVVWLRSLFAGRSDVAAIRDDISEIKTTLVRVDGDIEALKDGVDGEPSRLNLLQSISKLSDRMSRMEANSEADRRAMLAQHAAIDRQLVTVGDYLKILIEGEIAGGGKR